MAPIIYSGVFCYIELKGLAAEARLAGLTRRPGRIRNRGKRCALACGLGEELIQHAQMFPEKDSSRCEY